MPGTSIDAGQIKGTLVLNGKQFNATLSKAGKDTKVFSKGQKIASRNVANAWAKSFGKIAAAGAITFAFRAIVKEGAALEAKFANVSTLGNITAETMADMEEQVRSLSRELNQSPIELTEALYQVISSGAEAGAEAINLLTEATKLGIAGLSSTETAVKGISKAVAVYGKETLSFNRAANLMNRVVQRGVTTMEEFGPQVGRVASFAEALGVSFEEVSAASALLTRTMPTPQAMTALEGTMRGLTQASDKFAKVGVDIFEVLRQDGLNGALAELQKLTGGNIAEIKKLIPETEALKGILGLLKNETKDYNGLLSEMKDQTDTVNEAVAKQMDTTTARTEGLSVAFKNLSSTIFKNLQPAYDNFLTNTTELTEAFDDEIQNTFLPALTVMANHYAVVSEDMSGTSKTLAENMKTSFIFIIKAAGGVAKSIRGVKLAYSSLQLVAQQTGAAIQKEILSTEIKKVSDELILLNESINISGTATSQQTSRIAALTLNLKLLTGETEALDDETVKIYNDILDQAVAIETADLKLQNFIRTAETANRLTSPLIPQVVVPVTAPAEDAFAKSNEAILKDTQEKSELWLGSWETVLQSFQGFSSSVFSSMRDNFAGAIADISVDLEFQADAMDKAWKSMQKTVISGLVKVGIQQVAQFGLSKALGAARVLASQAEAAAIASAWAGPAALTSLASFGANTAPAAAGITSTVALANALTIPSRKEGGPISEGLFMGHDDEIVLNKLQTQQTSEILTKMNDRLDKIEAGSQTIVIKPKGDMAASFFNWFNFEVETNKRRAVASVTT